MDNTLFGKVLEAFSNMNFVLNSYVEKGVLAILWHLLRQMLK